MASEIKYWNGMLSSGTADGYSSVVNFDIVAPTYSWYGQKQRNTSFYYKKRAPYWTLNPIIKEKYKGFEFTDVVRTNDLSCVDGDCVQYIMAVNRNNGQMKILKTSCDECDVPEELCRWSGDDDDWCNECFCPCQYTKFIKTDFVKGTRRLLQGDGGTAGIAGIQKNIANGTVGTFEDTYNITNSNVVRIGDWIYAQSLYYGQESPNPTGVYGQARQVVGIKKTEDGRALWILNAPWTGLDIETQEGTGVRYFVYPERGEVVMFVSCQGLSVIHATSDQRDIYTGEVIEGGPIDVTIAETGFSGDVCIYSVNEYGGRINLLGNRGYNMYGGLQRDKLNFSVDNLNYVGEDKLSQTVFRNFLVQFGKENISVIVYGSSDATLGNINTFSYKLDASVGIFSPTAHTTFQNSLYMLGSDKRLYSVDITSNGMNGYMLNLTDQSAQLKGDLELLQEGDDVNISADGTHIYIFINNKTNRNNTDNTKTRILKYYRDYNKRVRHDLCCGIINGMSGNYYLGDSLYSQSISSGNPEMKDCGEHYIKSYIEAYIGENEDGQTAFTTLAYKKLKWLKILLGKGIYTDGSTKVVIDYGSHGYKQQYQIDKVEHIDWIDKNNKIRQGLEIYPDECVLDSLAECTNVVRECKGQPIANDEEEFVGGCTKRSVTYMDNCMCLDDKAFELSDVYNVWVDLSHLKKSELFKVRIMSLGGDEMVFGGMMLGVDTFDIADHDSENMDVMNNGADCCVEGRYIEENNLCGC